MHCYDDFDNEAKFRFPKVENVTLGQPWAKWKIYIDEKRIHRMMVRDRESLEEYLVGRYGELKKPRSKHGQRAWAAGSKVSD